MDRCGFVPDVDDGVAPCPRPTSESAEQCPFHLSPAERRRLGVDAETVRAAFRADVEAADVRRRTYADARFERLDLGSLLVAADHVEPVRFRGVTVEGTFDLSGSVVRHSLAVEECHLGRLDASDATFEDDVTVEGTTLGSEDAATGLAGRRTAFERGLRVADTTVEGSVELSACRVEGWLILDDVAVAGRTYLPNASLDAAQFVDAAFAKEVDLADVEADHLAVERTTFDRPVDLSGATLETLRARPRSDATFGLQAATVSEGRLDQPADGTVLYDLTDATVGEVDLDCDGGGLDRYRFYQTSFDGFPFASYRRFLRTNGWCLHEYAGTPSEPADTEGLELTYLAARRGASAVGDTENAAAFFVREHRYRRQRYADHALDADHSWLHQTDAAVRWATNGFLDGVAGYGERPQRIVAISAVAIVGCAALYPAVGGLATAGGTVTYATDGAAALVDGVYFSVVTFATLGLGDVHPAGDVGRLLAAGEALLGAFLTALFVFSLGRRVSR